MDVPHFWICRWIRFITFLHLLLETHTSSCSFRRRHLLGSIEIISVELGKGRCRVIALNFTYINLFISKFFDPLPFLIREDVSSMVRIIMVCVYIAVHHDANLRAILTSLNPQFVIRLENFCLSFLAGFSVVKVPSFNVWDLLILLYCYKCFDYGWP